MTTSSTGGVPGHRRVAHTADLRIEAWGPSRESVLAEAARGLVESFAEIPETAPATRREFQVAGETPEDQLVALLDELIYRMDADGEIPREVSVRPAGDGYLASLSMVDTAAVETSAAVPKAVALHELSFAGSGDGWRCSVTVDV